MKYDQLIQLYFERSNALQWYWTLYVVIIGGLLAFSSIRKQRDLITCVLVTILFVFFAYKNFGAIRDVTLQRLATLQAIRQATPPANIEAHDWQLVHDHLEPTLVAPTLRSVRRFHFLSDLLTIAAVWAMEYRRRRAAKSEARSD